jgi:hypothetical protein
MKNCCDPSECSSNNLTSRKTAWFLWYVPIAILVVGSLWTRGRVRLLRFRRMRGCLFSAHAQLY